MVYTNYKRLSVHSCPIKITKYFGQSHRCKCNMKKGSFCPDVLWINWHANILASKIFQMWSGLNLKSPISNQNYCSNSTWALLSMEQLYLEPEVLPEKLKTVMESNCIQLGNSCLRIPDGGVLNLKWAELIAFCTLLIYGRHYCFIWSAFAADPELNASGEFRLEAAYSKTSGYCHKDAKRSVIKIVTPHHYLNKTSEQWQHSV